MGLLMKASRRDGRSDMALDLRNRSSCSSAPLRRIFILVGLLFFLIAARSPSSQQPSAPRGGDGDFEAFRRMASLGFEEILLHVFADEEVLRSIDSQAESQMLVLDFNGDGMTDATAWREEATRVIATSAGGTPLPEDPRLDRLNVCYIADHFGDGIPDRVAEYVDTDGDGRADRQVLYEITSGELSAPGVGVFVYFDLDGDGGFLHTEDYGYHSARDCWLSDFNGNICLIAGLRDEETGTWHSVYENPFCFFDDDQDGFTDQAIRFEGEDLLLKSMRWSFDADGDAPSGGTYDYDFSITAVGSVRAPEAIADSVILRDGMPLRFASWDHARDLARWGLWRSVLFVWDEEDRNTDAPRDPAARERWEGVIAESFRGFAQVGGPSCGSMNNRYEIDRDGSGRSRIYYSSVDQRIHLSGAEEGELILDLASDPPIRRKMMVADRDGNGHFDHWSWRSQRDQSVLQSIEAADEGVRYIPLDTRSVREFWRGILSETGGQTRKLVDARARSDGRADSILHAWRQSIGAVSNPAIGRLTGSLETERLLVEGLLWDMGGGLFAGRTGQAPGEMVISLERTGRRQPAVIRVDRIPLSMGNAPSELTIVELSGENERIPGQAEDRDGDGTIDHLYFPSFPQRDVKLRLDPPSALPYGELVRADPWHEDGFALESARIGFIFSREVIGCLLKRQHRLVLRGDHGNLYQPHDWGLGVAMGNEGPGIGGLYLLDQDDWIQGFRGDGRTVRRIITEGPLRTVVEVLIDVEGREIERLRCVSGGASCIEEEVRVRGRESAILAFALPALDATGTMQELGGIWSFGTAPPLAEAVGVAGCVLSPVELEYTTVAGNPALRMVVEPGEAIRLAWTAGGVIVGDSTASEWVERAGRVLAPVRSTGPIYP